MVDLVGLLAEPAVVGPVRELVEAAVLAAHEDPAGGRAHDAHHVGGVGGQGEERLGQEVHLA